MIIGKNSMICRTSNKLINSEDHKPENFKYMTGGKTLCHGWDKSRAKKTTE